MVNRVIIACTILVLAISFSLVLAQQTPEERGKAHFNNPGFADGKRACSSCHPDGRGLEGAGAKTEFMDGKQASLEGAINTCIVNANKGHALEVDSAEMQELSSYIKSLAATKASGDSK